MRKRRKVSKPIGEEAERPSNSSPRRLFEGRTLDRWLTRLLVAAWLVFVIVMYFRLQIERVVQMLGAKP
jgi:hypothetical protein